MIKSIIQINELLLTSNKSRSACQVFVSKINPEAEKKLGHLFGIVEIDSRERENQRVISTLIEKIENYYYDSLKDKEENYFNNSPYSQPPLTGIENNVEAIFEESLQKLNRKLTELIREEYLNLLPEKLNAVIGVIKDKTLLFTYVGKINAFLIHKKKSGDYTMVNILENDMAADTQLSLIRIFSNLASGTIGAEDILIFSTPSLFDYFSLEKLKTTLTTLTLPSAIHQLKTMLAEAGPNLNFASIIIKLVTQREKKISLTEEKVIPSSSQSSMAELSLTHKKTKEFLAPSLVSAISKRMAKNSHYLAEKIKLFAEKIKKWRKTAQKTKIKQGKPKEKQPLRKIKELKTNNRPVLNNYQNLGNLPKISAISHLLRIKLYFSKQTKHLAAFTVFYQKKLFTETNIHLKKIIHNIRQRKNIPGGMWGHIIDKGRIKTKSKEFIEWLKRVYYYLHLKFRKLPRTSKILFITTVILGILFIFSLVSLNIKQKKEISVAAFNSKVEKIQKKIDAAEASIIYNDEEKGKKLLTEARALTNGFEGNSKTKQELQNKLLGEIEVLLEKIRHIKNIEEPGQIADFATVDSNIKISKIIKQNENLYTFNPDNNIIYRLGLGNKEKIETLEGNSTNLGHLNLAVAKNNESILFLHSNNGLLELSTKNDTLESKNITLAGDNPNIKDLDIFNNRLYILDAGNKQIYKHGAALSGYARGVPWLKDSEVDLSGAVSLSIDGSIYVLRENGEILKLTAGYRQNLKITAPDPAWNNPSKILAPKGGKYLYVLDAGEKRLVVFDKKGRLIVQYFSEKFDDLKDFAVDEKEKKIYLLSGTRVYGIIASHL